MDLSENIKIFTQSCIKFSFNKIIYFDPYGIDCNYNDADIIFLTHSHYDHFSEEDLIKVRNINTKVITPENFCVDVINIGFKEENVISVIPNKKYIVDGIEFETIPAYNINKPFHPKNNNWVGYIVTIDNLKYYIAGDTDITDENKQVKCDVAFVPVGGTYTMDYKEASELINIIKPKIAIPFHYGSIVGNKTDGKNFIELLDNGIDGKLLLY